MITLVPTAADVEIIIHATRLTEALANGQSQSVADHLEGVKAAAKKRARLLASGDPGVAPLDMLIFCPECGAQHIDAPEPGTAWDNPPHRSHQCHQCGEKFRFADFPTNGVAAINSRGGGDTWRKVPRAVPAVVAAATQARGVMVLRDLTHPDVAALQWEASQGVGIALPPDVAARALRILDAALRLGMTGVQLLLLAPGVDQVGEERVKALQELGIAVAMAHGKPPALALVPAEPAEAAPVEGAAG